MKDMRAVRFNEKVKRLSTVVGNGGLALVAASVARGWSEGLDFGAASALWFLLGLGAIWVSWHINALIEPEEST